MKKILFISNIAGSEIGAFYHAYIEAANRVGLEFHIASNFNAASKEQRGRDEDKYNIKIHHIDFVRNPLHPQNIKAYKQLKKIIQLEEIDIIHCNTPVGGVYGRLAAKKCNIKSVIYQAHGFHFYKGAPKFNWIVYYTIEKILACMTDKIITINKEDYYAAKKFTKNGKPEIHYIPGVGIDIKTFDNVSVDTKKCRKKFNVLPNDYVLLSVGRLEHNKNNETLLKAMAKVNDEKCHLFICGDGEEKDFLVKLSEELKIKERVHFLGNREDMDVIYKISDVLVMASRREGLSRVVMEAMASGLPCIISRIRGNIELIGDKKGGYLVEPTDANEFAKKIEKLKDISLRKKMSQYNKRYIHNFDIECVTNLLEKIYTQYI